MSSTDASSSSDYYSSDSDVAVNTPATRVAARRLFDRMPPVVDRIGALPDGVLHYLLSFLPVQEAVRTCVLAQRWRHLWKSTTGLRIVGSKGPGSVRSLRKFVDHLLILRDRTDLDTVEIGFSDFRQQDVPFVDLWIRFAVQSKVRALTVCHTHASFIQPFHLHGLPFASRYLTTLCLYGVCLSGTIRDFSSCPSLEDLKISFSIISVSKIAFRSLKHLTIFRCRSYLEHRVRVSAPCLVSLKLEGFSGRTPLLERMPLLESAFLRLDRSASRDSCLNYHHNVGVLGCGNDVSCEHCLSYNDGSSNSVLLGAIYNATHLELISSLGMGVRTNVEMKGSYRSMERSTVISQHLKIVDVKCHVVDEKVAKLLKFLCTLNLGFCFV